VLGTRYTNMPQGLLHPSTEPCMGCSVQAAPSRVHCSRHRGVRNDEPCLKQSLTETTHTAKHRSSPCLLRHKAATETHEASKK
jgi:hypothetical protein